MRERKEEEGRVVCKNNEGGESGTERGERDESRFLFLLPLACAHRKEGRGEIQN